MNPQAGAQPTRIEDLEHRSFFRSYVRGIYQNQFGVTHNAMADLVTEDWFRPDARHAHQFEALRERRPQALRILDMASGVGTTVLFGRQQGYAITGLEPNPEKLRLTKMNAEANGSPASAKHFVAGVGEALPFRDHAFDAVLSYQTLEHVQDVTAALREMIRAVKPGGALHLRCPDYRSTFEGHYLLPWLPLLPRPLARLYLRLLRRPAVGFKDINYVTQPNLIRKLRRIAKETPGLRIQIFDLDRERFLRKLRTRGLPVWPGFYSMWKTLRFSRCLFRAELQVNLWVDVERTD